MPPITRTTAGMKCGTARRLRHIEKRGNLIRVLPSAFGQSGSLLRRSSSLTAKRPTITRIGPKRESD